MNANGTQDEIEVMLDECEAMWAVSNIPPRRAQEMRVELAGHVRDGKPVEAVVGDDATIFALEWARENGPPRSLKGEAVDWLLTSLLATILVAMAHHLGTLSASFGFHWYTLAFITVPTLGGGFLISPRIMAAVISVKPRWKRELSGFLALTVVVGFPVALASLIGASVGGPLFEWSWLATLLVGVSAVAVWVLRDDPAVPGYEDMEHEPLVMDRGFILVALVVPLSALAAVLASALEPRLIFAPW